MFMLAISDVSDRSKLEPEWIECAHYPSEHVPDGLISPCRLIACGDAIEIDVSRIRRAAEKLAKNSSVDHGALEGISVFMTHGRKFSMKPIALESVKDIINDESTYEKVVAWFIDQLSDDFSPLMYERRVLGSVISPATTEQIIYDRITKQILESPEILNEIERRLIHDEIVD